MAGLKPPGPLSFDGNVGSNWQDWLRTYEFYEKATELEKEIERGSICHFLTRGRIDGAENSRNICFSQNGKKDK